MISVSEIFLFVEIFISWVEMGLKSSSCKQVAKTVRINSDRLGFRTGFRKDLGKIYCPKNVNDNVVCMYVCTRNIVLEIISGSKIQK
jgi:predicted peroxiredoxin